MDYRMRYPLLKNFLLALCVGVSSFTQAHTTIPPIKLSQGDFGGVGLWQTPTARMMPDGSIDFSFSHIYPYSRGNLALQALPWLEGIVRYTDIQNRAYQASTTGQSNKDKSLDAKFRLLSESYYLPQLAVGFRDFGGTGLFSSEYINASKRFYSFDVTLGIAWGKMIGSAGFKNPLCSLSSQLCQRGHQTGQGGTIGWSNFFRGANANLFGGLEYQTPLEPLRLKLEYDPNDYQQEADRNNQPQRSHWNVGAVYRLFNIADLSVAYERGNKVLVALSLGANFSSLNPIPKVDTAPIALSQMQHKHTNYSQVAQVLNNQGGLETKKIYQQGNNLVVVGNQRLYRNPNMAASRIGTILYNMTPKQFSHYTVINNNYGLLTEQFSLSRHKIWQQNERRLLPFDAKEHSVKVEELSDNQVAAKQSQLQSRLWQSKKTKWSYAFQPHLQQSIGGPDGFYLYQVLAELSATYQATENLLLSGGVSYNVFDNMGSFKYEPPIGVDPLPRVRSNIRRYLVTSRFALNRLQANYFGQLNQQWFGQVYGGYLESMFAGIGGEVLYRPQQRSFAIGLDVNAVQQRGFDRAFSLLPYKVMTGHLTSYYQLPFYNLLSKVSVGQYLAGDRGVTVDISRQFKSGIILGGFATKTNVSAARYGEGSFNKGVYISIPLDLFSMRSTVQRARLSWTPLTRDGGQPLARKYGLYDLININ